MSDVSSLAIHIIPLAWAAAVSPVILSVFLVVMSLSDDPKLPGVSFYLGAIMVFLITVFIGIFLGHKLAGSDAANPTTLASLDMFLGAVLVLLAFRNFTAKDENKGSRIFKFLQVDPEAGTFSRFRKYFVLGFIAFLTNFSSAIFILAAGREIGIENAGFMPDAVAIIILAIITLLVIEVPLLFFLILPQKSKKLTKPINEWISSHGNIVTGLFCLFIGLLIIYDGMSKLGMV
ncbi:MAG: GAP family protein [Methanobacterium sp.]|uniref:GAP family protein n=1 Tax=Methanobacterium sp. TaxID=2164 RepID=UPI003D6595A7|nr:GAP family protein [Methanobacterium sp.]